MTCRTTTENVSEPLPNLAELLAVNRSLLITRPTRRRRDLNPIVRLPADLLGGNWPTHETSQEFALTTAGFLHLRAS